uniref:SnoaL-like domain-containing protein n=1 Tax=OCS116 cluster bacterium TaxID=2030921 RepID=A0A2A4YTJ1_9PROT
MHSRLINQYINIFDTLHLDDLYDLLAENFHFKNPRMEIFGKQNYIKYAKDCYGIFATETIQLTKHNETEYTHEYYVSLFDTSWQIFDKIHVYEDVFIVNGLIDKAESRYEMDAISKGALQRIINAIEKHGNVRK